MSLQNSPALLAKLKTAEHTCGFTEVRYVPSPKNKNVSMEKIVGCACNMLEIYHRHKQGDKTAPIEEIFSGD